MKFSKYFKISLGLFAGALASATSVLGYPAFVTEWATEIKSIVISKNFKIEAPEHLENVLLNEINFDSFDASCSALLQRIIKESDLESALNLESALDICAVINPWNSMECSGITGVTASYARSIQEFVRIRDNSKGDLRAACLVASAIAPGRPFAPLVKGSIKSKCQEVCSGALSKTISAIDPSFCSLSIDLCSSVDFSLYSAFSSLNEKELGVAVAVSVLLSEGSIGLRTSFREGCRFVYFLKNKGAFPSTPSGVSESEFLSNISDFYRVKLAESGLLPTTDSNFRSTDAVFLRVLNSQVVKATKSILGAQIPKKQVDTKPKKPVIASTRITSSEVSPLSEDSDSSSTEIKMQSKPFTEGEQTSGSPVLESWFNIIKQSIKKGAKDIDQEFDDSLNKAIARIDSSSVYFSCVSELKRFNLGSHRRVAEACRKIDPFSHVKCQKLNHFELVAMIKLREELEKHSRDVIVDLKDLCAIAPKMSMESFLRTRDEELSSICIRTLRKSSFKSKYPISERAIKKACIKADYFRTSSCGNLVSNYSEKVNLVLSLANNMFDKRTDKERLQIIRESDFNTPSYADICSSVERVPAETVEECIFELRDSMSKFKSVASLLNIEGACIASFEEVPFGRYPPHYVGGQYEHYHPHSIYPDHLHHVIPKKSIRRFYKDIEFQPPMSSLQWHKTELPAILEQRAPFLEQEYSESRKGFYKDQSGKPVYHDGYRYRINGNWYVKVGDFWYIDNSSSLDFVKISPNDPRHNNYPLSFYEKSPSDPKGSLRRKSFATYLSPHSPYYYPQSNYLQTLYGKHQAQGYYPSYHRQPFYSKCEKCYNWIPYGHTHEHDTTAAVNKQTGSRFEEKLPSVKESLWSNKYITVTNEYDEDGKLISKTVEKTTQPEANPPKGKREVGVQVG